MKKFTLLIGILVAANILYGQNRQERLRGKAQVRIEEYKERLQLTETQLADLKSLREEMKPELEELRKNQTLTRPDKMRAHADLLEERQAEVAKILSEEQLTELDKIKEEISARRSERMERRKDRREERKERDDY